MNEAITPPDPANAATGYIDIANLPAPILRAIYRKITGRKESLVKAFYSGTIVGKNDIVQFCHKMDQICDRCDVQGKSLQFRIRHKNGLTAELSSLHKFIEYDESSPHAIEYISTSFGFLIKAPYRTEGFSDYKIELTIFSSDWSGDREAKRKLFQDIYAGGRPSIIFDIDYADYVVARNFLAAVDEWEDGLQKVPPNRFIEYAKQLYYPNKTSNPILKIAYLIVAASSLYASYLIKTKYFSANDIGGLFNLALISMGIFLVSTRIVGYVESEFEDRLRRYGSPKFIHITRGDQLNFQAYELEKNSLLKRSAVYVGDLATLVIVHILAARICGWFEALF
jgi:hypothetical protein